MRNLSFSLAPGGAWTRKRMGRQEEGRGKREKNI